MLSEKNLDKKEYMLHDSIYIKFQDTQTNHSDRKQIGGCLGIGVSGWWRWGKEGKITKEHEETLGRDEYI